MRGQTGREPGLGCGKGRSSPKHRPDGKERQESRRKRVKQRACLIAASGSAPEDGAGKPGCAG